MLFYERSEEREPRHFFACFSPEKVGRLSEPSPASAGTPATPLRPKQLDHECGGTEDVASLFRYSELAARRASRLKSERTRSSGPFSSFRENEQSCSFLNQCVKEHKRPAFATAERSPKNVCQRHSKKEGIMGELYIFRRACG